MKRWTTRLHAALYRLTGGRLLGRVGGQPVLLLETVGRRSGRRRTAPVQYLTDGASFVVVAANAGAPRPPAWWLNLRANAGGRIQVRADTLAVGAREAMGEERAALWLRLTAANRSLERAAQKAGAQPARGRPHAAAKRLTEEKPSSGGRRRALERGSKARTRRR